MALIPHEGPGAPSQKTSLVGGVAQILISPRPSPRLADVGLFCSTQTQQSPPRTKSLPCKLYYLHTERSNAPSRYRLLSVTPLHYGVNFLESQIVALQGLIALYFFILFFSFFRQWGGQAGLMRLCVIGVSIYRRTSPTHTTNFGAWLWYHMKDSRLHPKRLVYWVELPKYL